MKCCSFLLLLIMLGACERSDTNTRKLQARIDSLEQKLSSTYKPGFGEFMSGIQVHHAKLWFAGINNNWELADFEIHEIMESLDNLQIFQPDRKETKELPMLNASLDSVNKAVQQKDLPQFRKSYTLLTATCNDCHKAVAFAFNEVKIPDAPPFSNQVFTKK
jgi:hypothetical protein